MNPSSENELRKSNERSRAWGYFVTNLAVLPGLGTVAYGRKIGFAQILLAVSGVALTGYFVVWFFQHIFQSYASDQPLEDLNALFQYKEHRGQYAVGIAGFCLFAAGWLWSLALSVQMIRKEKTAKFEQEKTKETEG